MPKIIICRHVIEHVADVNSFLENILSLMDKDSVLVLELPSFELTAEKGDFSTIWEQHISYFTLQQMRILLQRHNLSILSHKYLEHGGGSLILFLTPGNDGAIR